MSTRSASAREAPAGDALRSPAGKTSNPKAPPARQTGKKRPAATAASNNTNGGGLRQRATRRELKKLTEMDLEEKDELPAGKTLCVCVSLLVAVCAGLLRPRVWRRIGGERDAVEAADAL